MKREKGGDRSDDSVGGKRGRINIKGGCGGLWFL